MQTPEQYGRNQIVKELIKELYVSAIGWAWIPAGIAALYFLTKAIFFGSKW